MGSRGRIVAGLSAVLCGGGALAATAASGAASPGQLGGLAALALLAGAVAWLGGPKLSRERLPELDSAVAELHERVEAAARTRHEMRMRAETAGRFREEFVAAVRHELKTPLNAIRGFTEVLLEEIDGPLSEQQQEDVVAIREAGLYLSELVEAVLADWVPEEREEPLPLARVDAARLLTEVARLLEGQATSGKVAVRVELAPELPRPLGDARRLRQVLINLGTNALRATKEGSVTLAAAPDEDGIRLSVRDTGTGISPDALPHLFEEFSQGGSPQSRRGGSGLGLALTRDLVEWHCGRIEVETALGEGSVFHVVLPLEPE
jgi:signal transduction histidine kinase